MVYVVGKNWRALMPTERYGKVKWLLRSGKAKVIRRCPFTIQLLYEVGEHMQPVILGVDAGSRTIGLSAVANKKEVYSGEVMLRNDIVELLSSRRELRRARRNRTTRYREARFDNRKRREGWVAPSVQNKIESHVRVIKRIHRILPVSKIIVEVAAFDLQKIRNTNIEGKEDTSRY